MRVLVTGASGYLGRLVVTALSRSHDVAATDLVPLVNQSTLLGDLTESALLDRLFESRVDAVVHLATLPGGACESDLELGWKTNVEATRALATRSVSAGVSRFVFASSIAALGPVSDRNQVDDECPPAPTLAYGAHKAMMEMWLSTLGRRGQLAPVALRLPGLVARPSDGRGLKSAFTSDLFRAALERRPIELPVSAGATMWLMSGPCAAQTMAHALGISADARPVTGTFTLPALQVRMSDLVAAISRAVGYPIEVDYSPDELIERDFGRYPPLATPAADALGFVHDGTLGKLVATALAELA